MKITVTGLSGTGKSTVAQKISKILGLKYMSGGNIFRLLAQEKNMTIEEFDVYVQNQGELFDKELDMRQKEYGEQNDNFICESRLGWYFIPDSIKIKLYCDLTERIGRISQDNSTDRIAHATSNFAETQEKTLLREKTYSRYDDLYNITQWDNDSHFDCIIDTTNQSSDEVAQAIIDYVEKTAGRQLLSVEKAESIDS